MAYPFIFQFQILVVLHALLKKSVENLQTCTKAGLITMLLDRISAHSDEMIAGTLFMGMRFNVIGLIACVCILLLFSFLGGFLVTE